MADTFFDSTIWARAISRYLLEEKSVNALSYKQIKGRLMDIGIDQSTANLSSKFNRGSISAQLFCATLIAIGETTVDLEKIQSFVEEEQKKEQKTGLDKLQNAKDEG
ncbi:MAG: hypothetical protein ACI93R_002880 [Flavobacteriales bacterium]|jgi:hypothetical protein